MGDGNTMGRSEWVRWGGGLLGDEGKTGRRVTGRHVHLYTCTCICIYPSSYGHINPSVWEGELLREDFSEDVKCVVTSSYHYIQVPPLPSYA